MGRSEIDADPLKSRWISGGCLHVPGFSRPTGKKTIFLRKKNMFALQAGGVNLSDYFCGNVEGLCANI